MGDCLSAVHRIYNDEVGDLPLRETRRILKTAAWLKGEVYPK